LDRQNISATSLLVLLLAEGSIHTSRNSKRYLESIDTAGGEILLAECNKIWPHYGEVIKNRKYCVMNLVLRDISQKDCVQLVILGGGMDALSVEVCSRMQCKVIAYEVDYEAELKAEMIEKVDDGLAESIRCVRADLRDHRDVMSRLADAGWRREDPSILVIEGVSYYLGRQHLQNLVAGFKTEDHGNVMVMEYLIPPAEISSERIHIADEVFALISETVREAQQIARYSAWEMESWLNQCGARVDRTYRMSEMEMARTGCNEYFQTPQSGWIEVCHVKI